MESNSDIIGAIRSNLDKFNKYNGIKLGNLQRTLAEQQIVNLLDFIPYLLTVNTTDLPGHVPSEKVPLGICGYTPPPRLFEFLARWFPGLDVKRGRAGEPFIQMLALIGSCGTIAFTKQSDFDFWICYHEGRYDREAINLFKMKLRSIETWIYDKFNVEIHFYLNEIGRVKNNVFADDEEQLSGSSIGELLKEEFLRSSIVLHGKAPFWWVVPSDADNPV